MGLMSLIKTFIFNISKPKQPTNIFSTLLKSHLKHKHNLHWFFFPHYHHNNNNSKEGKEKGRGGRPFCQIKIWRKCFSTTVRKVNKTLWLPSTSSAAIRRRDSVKLTSTLFFSKIFIMMSCVSPGFSFSAYKEEKASFKIQKLSQHFKAKT